MILSLLMAAASPAALPVASAVQPTPITCVATNVTKSGKFAKSRVEVSSGDAVVDRTALKNLRAASIPGATQPQSGYVLVTSGKDQFHIEFDTGKKLYKSCAEAFESRKSRAADGS